MKTTDGIPRFEHIPELYRNWRIFKGRDGEYPGTDMFYMDWERVFRDVVPPAPGISCVEVQGLKIPMRSRAYFVVGGNAAREGINLQESFRPHEGFEDYPRKG